MNEFQLPRPRAFAISGSKHMIIALLLTMSANAFAGGDSVTGKVTAFDGENGHYEMHFVQTSTRPALIYGCPEFNVTVDYRRVPWFSWFPFIRSANPSRRDTATAADALRNSQKSGREIEFGYMGYGLVPEKKACAFTSWGLRIDKNEPPVILAYHDQI